MSGPELDAAVSRAIGTPVDGVIDVRREPMDYDAFLAGRFLTRVTGTAFTNGHAVGWSFVEKVTDGPGIASKYLYDNGAREFAAYRSGLLDDLAPGLVAPGLLGATEGADGGLTLWIEDVGSRRQLSLDDVGVAARHLGRLAGRWLGRVPDHPWLFRGWIERHAQPEAMADGAATLAGGTSRSQVEPRIGHSLDDGLRLIAEQGMYRSALETLPVTLCHHDAVAANVFSRERDGATETVLIDWESVGPGPVGADLASLLFWSARRGDLSARDLPSLRPAGISAYAEGLDDTGAIVPDAELRLGFHAAVALRWTLVRDVVGSIESGSAPVRGTALGESGEQALEELIVLTRVLFDSAAEARQLLAG